MAELGSSLQKTIVVTGGANGIGLALTQHFLKLKHKLVIIDLDPRGPAEIKKSIIDNLPDAQLDIHQADISNWEAMASTFEQIWQKHHTIDIVFANAGIGEALPCHLYLLDELPTKPDLKVVDVNLIGNIYTIRLASYYMNKNSVPQGQRKGSIVCTASSAGLWPGVPSPIYSATKHGVVGLVRSTAPVLAKYGVQINALAPAFIRTRLTAAIIDRFHETPMSTVIRAAETFVNDPSLTGLIAEAHGDQVTLHPPPGHESEHDRSNQKLFASLAGFDPRTQTL